MPKNVVVPDAVLYGTDPAAPPAIFVAVPIVIPEAADH
jgi:hypothetical protein